MRTALAGGVASVCGGGGGSAPRTPVAGGWPLVLGGGRADRWRPWLLPGSVSLVLLELLCEAGAFGGRPRGCSLSGAGKYAAFWRECAVCPLQL